MLPQLLPPLQYADLPSQWGISVQRHPAGLRVVVPPVKSWRYLPRGYVAAVIICGGTSVILWVAIATHNGGDAGLIVNAIIYGSVAVAVLAKAVSKLRHQTVIDITRDELSVAFLNPSGRGERTSWPKRDIGNVTLNPFNGKLVIRITGDDLLEYPICPRREVARWVADTVRSAVFNEEFAPSPEPDWQLPAPRPAAHSRKMRYAAAGALALGVVAGIVLACLGKPIGTPTAVISLFGLVILCGMSYGTQEKKFFT